MNFQHSPRAVQIRIFALKTAEEIPPNDFYTKLLCAPFFLYVKVSASLPSRWHVKYLPLKEASILTNIEQEWVLISLATWTRNRLETLGPLEYVQTVPHIITFSQTLIHRSQREFLSSLPTLCPRVIHSFYRDHAHFTHTHTHTHIVIVRQKVSGSRSLKALTL